MTDYEIFNELQNKGIIKNNHCEINEDYIIKLMKLNYIDESIVDLLSLCDKLIYLTLEGTQITKIPENISKLSNLESLVCKKTSITTISQGICKLNQLTDFSISASPLKEIPKCIFRMSNLRQLALYDCLINEIPTEIAKSKSLEYISFSRNYITKIPLQIDNLSNLKGIRFDDNNIKVIPSSIGNLSNLLWLSFNNNQINEIPPSLLKLFNFTEEKMKQYKPQLSLKNNPIVNYINDSIENLNGRELIKYLISVQEKRMKEIQNRMINIERFFYPIGQGAFYAEKHQIGDENFTIVYDCGTCRNCKKGQLKFADTVIEKAFKKDEIIDILFISHFDFDHVSKIAKLKEHTQIKKVIMPLLHNNEKYLLSNIYRVLKFRYIVPLLENPEKFFGKNTGIIKIEPTDNDEIEDIEPIIINTNDDKIEESEPLISNKKMNNSMILKSGQPIQINSNSDWIFIPYNYEYKNRHKELIQKLYDAGFDDKEIESLQDGTRKWTPKKIKRKTKSRNSTIHKISKAPIQDINRIEIEDTKIFKKIYNSLSRHGKNTKINENSMLLYSGTFTNKKFKKKSYSYDLDNDIIHGILIEDDRVSCIYTGDTTLSVVDIKTVFRTYWNTVGTIQIPHHGDKESFDKSILDNKDYCCPISFGTTNPYKHPSKSVTNDILSQESYPILVSEYLNSGFIEYINNKEYIRLEKLGILKELIYLK